MASNIKMLLAASGNSAAATGWYSWYSESNGSISQYMGHGWQEESDGTYTSRNAYRINDSLAGCHIREANITAGTLESRFEYNANYTLYPDPIEDSALHYNADDNAVYFNGRARGSFTGGTLVIAKYNASTGARIWQKTHPTGNNYNYCHTAFLSGGDPVIFFYWQDDSTNRKVSVCRLSKTDGSLTWSKTMAGVNESLTPNDIVVDSSDNIYTLSSYLNTPYHAHIQKHNASGVFQSSKGLWNPNRAGSDPTEHMYGGKLFVDANDDLHCSVYRYHSGDGRANEVLHQNIIKVDMDAVSNVTVNTTEVRGGESNKSQGAAIHYFFYDTENDLYYQTRNLNLNASSDYRYRRGIECYTSRQFGGTSTLHWRLTAGTGTQSIGGNGAAYMSSWPTGFVWHCPLEGSYETFVISPTLGDTDFPSVSSAVIDGVTWSAYNRTSTVSVAGTTVYVENPTYNLDSGYYRNLDYPVGSTPSFSNSTTGTMTASTNDNAVDDEEFEANLGTL